MLTFAYPWLAVLVPLPFILRRWLPAHLEPRPAVRAPMVERLARLTGTDPETGVAVSRRQRSQWILLVLCWLLMVLGLMRPQWLEEPVVRELPMRDLLLAVDLSGSMETTDFVGVSGRPTDRLSMVKQVLDGFLEARDGDRVGLIFFGSAAFVQVPFTDDLDVVRELLDEAQVRMLGPRTMMGDAMGLAINLFKKSELDERVMILLTDGNDTGSLIPPERAAEIARDEGVVVHAVAIGSPEAANEEALDEASLKNVAETTGGLFFHASERDEMVEVYRLLDEMNPRAVETVSFRPRHELYFWPLAVTALLLIASLGWQEFRFWRNRVRSTPQAEGQVY